MKIEQKPREFLALTGLEEFWDTSRPLLFLGEWCKDHKKRHIWEELDAQVLESDELRHANSYEAYQYAMGIYEKLLPKLIDWLNEIHGLKHSLQYWRLLVGPFLFLYIQTIYMRFIYLQAAFHTNPDLETYGLLQDAFLTPISTGEAQVWSFESDTWNLQILTQLLNLSFKRPINFKSATWEAELKQRNTQFLENSYKNRTKFLLSILRIVNKARRSQMVGILDGFSKMNIIKLMLRSGFRILPLLPTIPINRGQILGRSSISRNILDLKKRNQLLAIPVDDELSKLVIHTLPINMPSIFIEGYEEEVVASKKYFPYVSKLIMLESCCSYDQYKFWIGEQLEAGSKLIGFQHGGCYGMQKAASSEFLERHVSDFFISWGWRCKNVLPAPIPHGNLLVKKFQKNKKSGLNEILWVATQSNMRYQLSIYDWSISSKPYLSYQKRFISALKSKITSQICMRLNPSSTNFDEVKEHLPELKIYLPEDRDGFFTHLAQAKMVVIDHASTPFLYTLLLNVQTILFWDTEQWAFRNEAKPYLEALESVGIYHDSPEAAAKMLNNIADNPFSWWNSETVQTVRQKFCNNFIKISKNYINEWVELLLSLNKIKKIDENIAITK